MKYCGATAKTTGKPCRRTAGWGTDHVGAGRCRLHGGATPIKSGRYSKVKRERLASLIEDYEADEDPLNVLPEIAAARALFQDYIERYDEWREMVLDKRRQSPPSMLDIADAYKMLANIAKMAQQEKRTQIKNAITRHHLQRMAVEQREIVMRHADSRTAKKILHEFQQIRLG